MKLKFVSSATLLPELQSQIMHFNLHLNMPQNELPDLTHTFTSQLPLAPQMETSALDLEKSLHLFLTALSYLPPTSSSTMVLPVKYILCFTFSLQLSSATTLVHLGLLQETPAGSNCHPGPDITPHAGARTIFFKPMTTHVTHLIKTFQ